MIPDNLKPIPNYPDYFADKNGNVWSIKLPHSGKRKLDKPRMLKQDASTIYRTVVLMRNKKRATRLVHQIILETFISPRPDGMWACHGVGGKQCNSVDNLYWATPSQNLGEDKLRDGTLLRGEKNHCAKLNNLQVRIIRRAHELGKSKKRHDGITMRYLAKTFGVSQRTIYDIVNMVKWIHV